MAHLSGIRPILEPRREYFDSEAAYRYFLELTRFIKEIQSATADDIPSQEGPVADLNQTISNPPTQSEVQAISDKVDELLAELRASGILSS